MSQFFRSILAILFAILSAALVAGVEGAEQAFLTAEEGGRDYSLQGEFVGIVETWGGAYGAQVISLGSDTFDVVLYAGGLPGDGYRNEVAKKSVAVKAEGDIAQGSGDGFAVQLQKNALSITDLNGKSIAQLAKVQRQSPTMGAKPPKDALILFDGTSVDAFKGGQLNEDKCLGVGCETVEKFGDHRLHLEFRTPFMPLARGQKRGNSGVYLQSRYEVQVLDSFGLAGKDNECGGIYKVAEPNFNMCFPPLTWQTYDIDFTAAKYDDQGTKSKNAQATIRLNGVVIHQDLELPSHTPGKNKEANEPGALFLQNHNDPVVYRNIWIVKK